MLRITGRIFREEGMLVAELAEIGQTTWAHTLDDIMADVPRLVFEYIGAAEQAGTLGRELVRLGATVSGGQLQVHMHVELSADALRAQPQGAMSALDTQLSVPIAA
jgi:hypothetical protein